MIRAQQQQPRAASDTNFCQPQWWPGFSTWSSTACRARRRAHHHPAAGEPVGRAVRIDSAAFSAMAGLAPPICELQTTQGRLPKQRCVPTTFEAGGSAYSITCLVRRSAAFMSGIFRWVHTDSELLSTQQSTRHLKTISS